MVYVFLFLIDGMGHYYLQRFKGVSQPITNQVPPITSPNWVSILTGLSPDIHKIVNNEMVRKKNFQFNYSTLFDDGWKSSLFITDWKMMFKYVSKAPSKCYTKNIWQVLREKWQRTKPHLTVINTDKLDATAHKHGWKSRQAIQKVINIENEIIAFKQYMDKKSVPYAILVTADHGGWEKDHDNPRLKSIRTTPLIFLTNTKRAPPCIKTNTDIRTWLKTLIQ